MAVDAAFVGSDAVRAQALTRPGGFEGSAARVQLMTLTAGLLIRTFCLLDWNFDGRTLEGEVEPEIALDARHKGFVARGGLLDHLFVGLRRSGFDDRRRIRSSRVPQLPAVVINDVPDHIGDDGGRCRSGERCREQRLQAPPWG